MSRGRSFCFTLNNYTDASEGAVQSIDCVYIVYGREVGAAGTPHLQGYLRFAGVKSFNVVRQLLLGAHVTNARTTTEAIAYCKKDGDYFEKGVEPIGREAGRQRGGDRNAQRFEDAYKAAREGRMDEIPAEFKFKYGNAILRMRYKYLEADVPDSIPVLDNHWFWGPSGFGKSTTARHEFPGAYIKMRNKWWDKYDFEDAVIIDDVDPTMEAWLTGFLKDWGDHHKFRCETKGSSVAIRPKNVIVTSQYHITECFKDPRTVEALMRRFQVRRFGPGFFEPDLSYLQPVSAEPELVLEPLRLVDGDETEDDDVRDQDMNVEGANLGFVRDSDDDESAQAIIGVLQADLSHDL